MQAIARGIFLKGGKDMTNEDLVQRVQSGAAPEAMEQLYKNNEGFIKKLANRYKGYGEFDDLVQEGFCGLYEAAKHYECGSEMLFTTYAAWWIKQAMRRYVLNCYPLVRVPEHTAEKVRAYRRFINQYCQYYGQEPPRTAIQSFLGLDDKMLGRIEKAAEQANIQSLDEPLKMDEELSLGDTIGSGEDMETDVVERIASQELKAELWGIVDSLGGKHAEVLRCRYQDDQTLKAVGEHMGLSCERIRQVEREAMKKLQLPKYTRRLRPYLPEIRELTDRELSIAYRGGARQFKQTWTSAPEKVVLRRLGCR